MYAIIEDSGQQFKIHEGDVLDIDLCDSAEAGKTIDFDRVLLVSNEGDVKIGTPLVKGAKVQAEVVDEMVKGEKIHVYRWRRRKASRNKTGHRQKYTRIKVTKIVA